VDIGRGVSAEFHEFLRGALAGDGDLRADALAEAAAWAGRPDEAFLRGLFEAGRG